MYSDQTLSLFGKAVQPCDLLLIVLKLLINEYKDRKIQEIYAKVYEEQTVKHMKKPSGIENLIQDKCS